MPACPVRWFRSCCLPLFVRPVPLGSTLAALYGDGNRRLDLIAAGLTPETGSAVLDYLHQACAAVHEASAEIAAGEGATS